MTIDKYHKLNELSNYKVAPLLCHILELGVEISFQHFNTPSWLKISYWEPISRQN